MTQAVADPTMTLDEALAIRLAAEGSPRTNHGVGRRMAAQAPRDGTPYDGLGLGRGDPRGSTQFGLSDGAALAALGTVLAVEVHGTILAAYAEIVVAISVLHGRVVVKPAKLARPGDAALGIEGIAKLAGDRWLCPEELAERTTPRIEVDAPEALLASRLADLLAAASDAPDPVVGIAHEASTRDVGERHYEEPEGAAEADWIVGAIAGFATGLVPARDVWRVRSGRSASLESGWMREPAYLAVEAKAAPTSSSLAAAAVVARGAARRRTLAWLAGEGAPDDLMDDARARFGAAA